MDRAEDLRHWAGVVRKFLRLNLTVYGYFNNHYMGHSPGSVRIFTEMLQER